MKPETASGEPEIQPADPGARKRALWAVLAVVILAGALALAIELQGDQMSERTEDLMLKLAGQPGLLFLAAFIVMLPLVGASIHIFRLAGQVVRSQRMPPPGRKVIKDTPVIRGSKAVRQGRGLQITAVFMGLTGTLLPFGLAILLMLIQKGT